MSNAENINHAIVQGILDAALSYPIKWAGTKFDTPQVNQPWLAVHSFYSTPSQFALESIDKIKGFLQIDINVPKNEGTQLPFQIADEIRAALPVNFEGFTHNDVKVNFESVGLVGNIIPGERWDKAIVEAHFYIYVDRNA